MQKLFHWSLALAMVLTLMVSPSAASAAVATHVVISQLETGTSASASQEFIELYNPTDQDVSLNGWTVEYKAATSTDMSSNWVKHASLAGVIKSYSFYLVAPKTYLADADADWSATLSGSGGNVRLKDGNGSVVDQLGYGNTANAAEAGAPASAPPADQSIERLPGRLDAGNGNGVDTDNNAADFILEPMPEPRFTQSLPEPPGAADSDMMTGSDDVTQPVAAEDDSVDGTPAAQSYAPVDITELLVNPMTPLTDANDEFIELFNPTDSPINLAGYTIRAGSKFHSYYVLPSTTLASGAYAAFYSAQTNVSMPNTGGAVEVLDPSGMVVDVTPAYGAAPDGQAWARFDDGWHWTLQTSPGQPNVLATAITLVAPTATKTPKAKAAKKIAVKATKAKKAKKVYVPHPRKKKPKVVLAKAPMQLTATKTLQPATWLLIGLGVLTIGYASYEFRYDIQNLYYRCRRDGRVRAVRGQADKGGDRD
jgi:hypothetical protein